MFMLEQSGYQSGNTVPALSGDPTSPLQTQCVVRLWWWGRICFHRVVSVIQHIGFETEQEARGFKLLPPTASHVRRRHYVDFWQPSAAQTLCFSVRAVTHAAVDVLAALRGFAPEDSEVKSSTSYLKKYNWAPLKVGLPTCKPWFNDKMVQTRQHPWRGGGLYIVFFYQAVKCDLQMVLEEEMCKCIPHLWILTPLFCYNMQTEGCFLFPLVACTRKTCLTPVVTQH